MLLIIRKVKQMLIIIMITFSKEDRPDLVDSTFNSIHLFFNASHRNMAKAK